MARQRAARIVFLCASSVAAAAANSTVWFAASVPISNLLIKQGKRKSSVIYKNHKTRFYTHFI